MTTHKHWGTNREKKCVVRQSHTNEMRWRQPFTIYLRCSWCRFSGMEIDMFKTRFRLLGGFFRIMSHIDYSHVLPAKCVLFDLHFHLTWLKSDQIKPESVIVYSVHVFAEANGSRRTNIIVAVVVVDSVCETIHFSRNTLVHSVIQCVNELSM